MPKFTDLPEIGNGFRMAGSTMLDEETFLVEEWHLYRNTEWRPTIAGIHRMAELKEKRRNERKVAWQARQESEEEFGQYVNGLLDEEEPKP
jgi:hypothetical protein